MRYFATPPFGAALTRARTDTLTLLVDPDDVVARAFAVIDATPDVDDRRAAIAKRFCTAMLLPLDGIDEQLASIRAAAGELASRRLGDALATFGASDDGDVSIAPDAAPAFARGVPPPLALTAQEVIPLADSIRGWSWGAHLAGTMAATDSLHVSIASAASSMGEVDAPPFVAACAALVYAPAGADIRPLIDAIAAATPEPLAPVTLPPPSQCTLSASGAAIDIQIDGLDLLVTLGGQLVFGIVRNGALKIASAFRPATAFAGLPLQPFLDRRVGAFLSIEPLLIAMLTPDGVPAFTSCEATIRVDAVKLEGTLPVSIPIIAAVVPLPIPFAPMEDTEALDRTVATLMPEGATAAYDVTITCDGHSRLRVRAG